MKALSLRLAVFGVFVASACATETPVAPTPMAPTENNLATTEGPASGPATITAVVDQNISATYDWHAGDAFLAAVNPAFSPDVVQAPNGERIVINGTGTLGIHPKFATGGGTFSHLNSTGAVLGSGTFTVVELLSFVSYGTSPATPPTFNSGEALLRALFFPGGTGSGIEAILRIECMLPEGEVPNGLVEGVNVNVPGVGNFQQQVSGNTVFVRTS
jgi:hypothetical protein